MLIKGIRDEDFCQYKKPSMFIAFPNCTFKCEKECGVRCCQNSELTLTQSIEVDIKHLVQRYISNPITKAVVMGGLEPFDSWDDLYKLICELRKCTNDDIVVYTGFYKEEIIDKIKILKQFPNIILKMGRFIPGQQSHKDPILGVDLIGEQQYAEDICNG